MEKKSTEYPKAMHGPNEAYKVVNSKEEEEALGQGWVSGHEHWAAKAKPEAKKEPKASK